MNTHTRLRNRPSSTASRPLAALLGAWLPGFLDDPFRVACVARTRKAPPGTELLCLVHFFMDHPG
ncbi:MAG: hypothetical protein QF410_00335 [Planctomycetota bacterium]|nr:hypothetical protein [Planctomycetota bacterium]